ncbi:NmrA family NAD(P)-binding protein [Blastomonas fulva]|uniref:NmrA family NAD(P)-binding protein n=1 Tax=Blastomonas fulva TaxID=1550728 RepID=UPI0025A33740|nr:NAD(P)H-binding protein [Blastomonas fulva]MDM7928820.1 NAD(P)H-binding protein [Blastomonas fulva]MDM7964606.1 NAD(P)H-binding protein [Blastomonas fulva]
MIVITAPTGNIGRQVVSALLDKGVPLRLVVRDPAKLDRAWLDRAEIVKGSHADGHVLDKALDGATRIFWLVPSDVTAPNAEAAYVDFSRPFGQRLAGSAVTHVVSVSALGRGWNTDAGHASASIRMDDMLAASGVNYVSLAAVSLMSNIARQTDLIRAQGVFYYPAPGNLKLRHVAPQDVSTIAIRKLLSPDWSGFDEIPMVGPRDLTYQEIAAIMTDVLGRKITFHEMSMADMGNMMKGNGASEGMARAMVDMLSAKNEGLDHVVERSPADIVNSPTTFRQWCEGVLKPALMG